MPEASKPAADASAAPSTIQNTPDGKESAAAQRARATAENTANSGINAASKDAAAAVGTFRDGFEDRVQEAGGVLRKFPGTGVWSYPGVPMDRSGANVVYPEEYFHDKHIQDGIREQALEVVTTDVNGHPLAVRVRDAENPVAPVSIRDAGTAYVGTESSSVRPEIDASTRPLSPAEAAAAHKKAIEDGAIAGHVLNERARLAAADQVKAEGEAAEKAKTARESGTRNGDNFSREPASNAARTSQRASGG